MLHALPRERTRSRRSEPDVVLRWRLRGRAHTRFINVEDVFFFPL